MRHSITSTLDSISEQVFNSKTATEAKDVIIKHLSDTRVKDKEKMINELNNMKNLTQIWRYFSGALLKFEGLGMNQLQKTARQAAADDSVE